MKIWTKAFWEDAVERVGSTFVQVLLGAMLATGINFASMGHWSFWEPLLWATAIALVKVLVAGFVSPNTGASFGTTNPAGIVKALVTQKDVVLDGDKVGMGVPDEVIASAGETVAGKAAVQETGSPVAVVEVGPSPYTPPSVSPPPQ